MPLQQGLQQQIQREMEEEAKKEKKIAAMVKKVFKTTEVRKYRKASTRKLADAVFILDRTNLNNYCFVLYEEADEHQKVCIENPNNVVIFLKNKNPHDGRKATCGEARRCDHSRRTFFNKT